MVLLMVSFIHGGSGGIIANLRVIGGIQRGSDVVKALCLGAKAVGIGRAALYGLGAGGPDGVRRVLQSKWLRNPINFLLNEERVTSANAAAVLNDELQTAMRLLGARNVNDLGPQHVCEGLADLVQQADKRQVNTRVIENYIYNGPGAFNATAYPPPPKL